MDAVFAVPLRRFYVPRPETRYAHRDIDWGDTGQFRLRLHEFTHGCERSGETYVIWGLTAHVCAEVAAIIYGGADTGGEAVKVVLDLGALLNATPATPLVARLLALDPNARASCADALKDAYFAADPPPELAPH